eukprot:403350086
MLHDTDLTDNGWLQAQITGILLKNIIDQAKIEENPFEEIIFESSPFLRCLQTSSGIAKELDISEIKVNFAYREYLGKYIFEGNPIGNLFIDVKDQEYISQSLKGMKLTLPEEYLNNKETFIGGFTFPETMIEARQRITDYTDQLINEYQQLEKRIMHIICSHGPLVQEFSYNHGGQNGQFSYCQVSAIEIDKNQCSKKRKLLFDNSVDHLQN